MGVAQSREAIEIQQTRFEEMKSDIAEAWDFDKVVLEIWHTERRAE